MIHPHTQSTSHAIRLRIFSDSLVHSRKYKIIFFIL